MQLSAMCRKKNDALWNKTLSHPMLKEMAEGTLPEEKFRYYMLQDGFYLMRYIDIFAVMLEKATSLKEKRFVSDNIADVIAEIQRVHLPNMEKIGITQEDMEKSAPHIDVLSYTNYMKEIAEKGDYLSGLVAILNCSWSYAFLAEKWVAERPQKIRMSRYGDWFWAYASGDYVETNAALIRKVDDLAKTCTEKEKQDLTDVFYHCGLYEYRLWDMFYAVGDNIVGKESAYGLH